MQEQYKEKGLDIAQVVALFTLLVLPQVIGQFIITSLGVTEVEYYLEIFVALTGTMVVYYLVMIYFNQRLITRIYNLVYLKYLVVIIILFWLMYDGITAYYMQENYLIMQRQIGPRDIVWRDVPFEDLPEYVIYPNFRYAFMFCLCVTRFILVVVLAIGLMTERREPQLKKKVIQRQKLRNKSVEELKAGLHPSILKKYQDEKKTD